MIIKCAFDGHEFERTGRGRPPKFCDLHKPKDDSVKITSHSAEISPEKSKSVFDIVPGLKELVQQDRMKTYICQYGDTHPFEQESRRGRPPRYCDEHKELALKSSKSQPRVISSEKKEEAKKKLEEAIQYHLSRVSAAEGADNIAYLQLQQESADDNLFNNWLRKNSILLNEVLSLRAQESKLITL